MVANISFLLSALTDCRPPSLALLALSAASNLVWTVIQPFIFPSFLLCFGGHKIFSSNDVASPLKLVSSLSLSFHSSQRRSCLVGKSLEAANRLPFLHSKPSKQASQPAEYMSIIIIMGSPLLPSISFPSAPWQWK